MPATTTVRVLARGLAHRGGSTLAVLVVALVAAAAAAVGPAYYAAAQTSILRDTVTAAPASLRGIEFSTQSELPALPQLSRLTQPAFRAGVPADVRARALGTPIEAIAGTVILSDGSHTAAPLVWRSDVCANLRFRSGRCATAPGQLVISTSLASMTGFTVGKRFTSDVWGPLTVVGVYRVPDFTKPYWFDHGGDYFQTENGGGGANAPAADAAFTTRPTMLAGRGQPQGSALIDQPLRADTVQASDLDQLERAIARVQRELTDANESVVVQTGLPHVRNEVHASWRALEISVLLVTLQLLVLVWLVMFTVVGDAIAARGPEIALAKLRGRRGIGLLGFALGEPIALLALALPLGVGIAALACLGLDSVLLRPGTSATLPGTAWLAALVATLGGLVATVVAGRRTLRRGVLDQWQHAAREATRRGWLIEGIVLTAAVAAVVELIVGGQVTSTHAGTLGLLVPGLLGLAVAVVASRLLPWLARRSFARTRRSGGLGAFLAVRQVARRTAGARTTIVLAAAFALATFAVAAWSAGQSNRRLAADVQVGAPSVLTVSPPDARTDLGAVVDHVDPGGTKAAVVDDYYPGTSTVGSLLAVDPQRFAHVAAWRTDFASQSLTTLLHRLAPPAAPQVRIPEDTTLRVRLTVRNLRPAGLVLGATLGAPGESGAVDATLGTVPRSTGPVTLSADVGGCPCTLRSLDLSTGTIQSGVRVTGQLTLDGIDIQGPHGFTALPGLQRTTQWRQLDGTSVDPTSTLSVKNGHLVWPVDFDGTTSASLAVADAPSALPAVVSPHIPTGDIGSVVPILGLDGNEVPIKSIARAAAVPGAPSGGVLVDREYAERAANFALAATVAQQVWVAAGAERSVAAGLRAAHVKITDVQSAGRQTRLLNRQGPGLASTVLLTDALAAAVLAAGGALAALAGAARRRRFEYAALGVAGASRRNLYAGLVIEQAAVLVFGAVAGVVAGVVAALLALRSLPEFVTVPSSITLSYRLPAGTLVVFVVVAVLVLFALAAGTSAGLLAGASPERLREIEE